MITAKNMEELQRNVDQMRVAAANGTLTSGPVEVLLDRINTLRNTSYDTPYFRALEAMYAQVESLLDQCGQRAA